MNPILLPCDSAAMHGGSSGKTGRTDSGIGTPGAGAVTRAGHHFTRAQIDLQKQIGEMDGFADVQAVLRGQLERSMRIPPLND